MFYAQPKGRVIEGEAGAKDRNVRQTYAIGGENKYGERGGRGGGGGYTEIRRDKEKVRHTRQRPAINKYVLVTNDAKAPC